MSITFELKLGYLQVSAPLFIHTDELSNIYVCILVSGQSGGKS